MAPREVISTPHAPAAIGTYSQAVKVGQTVYISGQLPLDPETMALVGYTFPEQCERVFQNVSAIAQAAGGTVDDIVKLTVYLVDLANFATVNEIMAVHFTEPYPARAAVQVAALPKDAPLEIEAVMELDSD